MKMERAVHAIEQSGITTVRDANNKNKDLPHT
jgi:hypothetical protein